jgi:hypothetical protein
MNPTGRGFVHRRKLASYEERIGDASDCHYVPLIANTRLSGSMNDKTKSIRRLVGAVGGAIFAPFVLFSTYLVFRIGNEASFWFVLVISSLAGAAFIGLLPFDTFSEQL